MQIKSNCLFFISLLLFSGGALAQDSTRMQRQLRLGIDLFQPIINAGSDQKKSYEVSADFRFNKTIYLVAEGGFGQSNYHYPDLSYNTTISFLRLGFDKSLLPTLSRNDWDMAFVGLRYGLALINRNEAAFVYNDPLYGRVAGTVPGKNLTAHWLEITGGVKVFVWKNIFAGWSVRGKFLLNQKSFRELAPNYIAGYGRGDKNTNFGFNFYVGYGLRW